VNCVRINCQSLIIFCRRYLINITYFGQLGHLQVMQNFRSVWPFVLHEDDQASWNMLWYVLNNKNSSLIHGSFKYDFINRIWDCNTKWITDISQLLHIDRCFQKLLLCGVCICNYKNDLLHEDRVMTAISS